ncbi:MAG: PQQ-dependent sugar dehydrogenase [Pirellulales bacterium]
MPSMQHVRIVLFVYLVLAALIYFADEETHAQTLTAQPIVSGLQLPSFVKAPNGDTHRLFITEQKNARVKIFDLDTQSILPTPFLDLPDITSGSENGLQVIAFHPDYANNGRFYINYSDGSFVNVVEYTVSADPNVADPTSARPILSFPHTNNHNGGWLGFSPIDGMLYIGTGDGGTMGITSELRGIESQDLNQLKGKILRIDVNGDDFLSDPQRNYAIPTTNPFIGVAAQPEVWAYGLRHPFRSSFDPKTGDLLIGDVGSNHWEEINYQVGTSAGGENYGWRPKEGLLPNPSVSDPIPPNTVDPIHTYAHGPGAAVIGGFTYRGQSIPSLDGTYFFSEYINKQIESFKIVDGTATNLTDHTAELFPLGSDDFNRIASFGLDGRGELYLIDRGEGEIYKISAASGASVQTPSDVWIGNVSGNWSDDANWQDGGAPGVGGGSDQILEFNYLDIGPPPTFTNDLAATFMAHGLIINSPGPAGFVLDGNPVELVNDVLEAPFIESLGSSAVLVNMDIIASDVVTVGGAGADLTLGGNISGTGGLMIDRFASLTTITGATSYTGGTVVKNGPLLMTGTIASSSGVTIENRGRLDLEYTAAADKIDDSTTVTLDMGELVARNQDPSPVTEAIGQLVLKTGTANTITLAGSTASMVLDADSLQREATAALLFRGSNLGAPGTHQVHFSTPPALIGAGGPAGSTSMSIIPLALGDLSELGSGSSFVTYDAVNGVVPLDTLTEYATGISSGTTSSDNVRSTIAIGNIDASTTTNSLLMDAGASLSGSGTLNLTSGSILSNGANGGIGVASLVLVNSESMIWTHEDLSFTGDLDATGSLTKGGNAQLILSGATSVTGETSVVGGSIVVNGGTFSTSALLLNGEGTELIAANGTTSLGTLSISHGGILALTTDQLVTVAADTMIENDGVLRIDGGTLQTVSLSKVGGNIFFVSGLLDLTGPAFLVDDTGPLGSAVILDPSKSLNVAGTTTIGANGALALTGGTLNSDQLVLDGLGASFSATSGTLNVNDMLISNGAVLATVVGESLSIVHDIMIDNTSALNLNGGSLTAEQLFNNGGTFDFTAGSLELTNSDLTVDAPGLLGASVTLDSSKSLNVSGTTTIGSSGSLILTGGTLSSDQLVLDGLGASFSATSGTLNVIDMLISNGAALAMDSGENVSIVRDVVIDSTSALNLNGGSLIAEQLLNNIGGTFNFSAGSLELTNSDLTINAPSLLGASVTIDSGKSLSVSGTTTIGAGGTLDLAGGSFTTGELVVDGPNATLSLNGAAPTVDDFSLTHGVRQELALGHNLVIANTTHIGAGSVLHLVGGTLTTGDILVEGALDFDTGTLELTNQGFTVGSGGLFGQILTLTSGQQLKTGQDVGIDPLGMLQLQDAGSLTTAVLTNGGTLQLDGLTAILNSVSLVNNGVIRGTGRILSNLTNTVSGEIRAQSNDNLLWLGSGHTNAGKIEVIGAEIEFIGALTNESGTGIINARDAILRFSGGLVNNGTVNLSFGTSDVSGNITNTDKIIVAGGSNATFFDDVDNNGEIRTSAGGFSVFFGSVTGAGTFTGTGTTAFEGELQPGNSPAEIPFSGDVRFGQDASLEIEIGGSTAGTEFDRLVVAGSATLDGTLWVDLIDSGSGEFQPSAGDTFEILSAAGGITGQFSPNLPTLTSDLEWSVNYTPTSLFLEVLPTLFRADFDTNGTVNGDDLSVWQTNSGTLTNATRMLGDADSDSDVDGNDILIWQQEFGLSIPQAINVPEPCSQMMILAIFSLPLISNRFRSWHKKHRMI